VIYYGIDPGKSGAMAIISPRGIDLVPFDEDMYVRLLDTAEPAKVCLEHVSAMPGQGVTSMFNFGLNFGWIQGLLDAYCLSYELVRPQKWKKAFGITSDKNTSIAVCKRLFPNVSLKRTERCRKDDDNLAEALLMAEYARRCL
jgi:crossover junction endodeoxyribonuclease RuvC